LLWLLPSAEAARAVEIVYAEELYPPLATLLQQSMDAPNSLAVGALEVEALRHEAARIRGENLPQVRLYWRAVGSYEIRDDIGNDFAGDLFGNITATQNLYHWGALRKRVDIARQRVELADEALAGQTADHLMELRLGYLRWQALLQREVGLQRSLELSTRLVEGQRQLADAGQAAEQEVLEMEARLLESMETQVAIEREKQGLLSFIQQLSGGIPDPQLLAMQSLDRIQPLDDAAFERLQQRVAEHKGVPSREEQNWRGLARVEADHYDVVRRQTWPVLQAVAGVYTDQLDAINATNSILRTQLYVGLQVNWNIFDGWQTEASKRATLARQRSHELQAQMAAERADSRAADLLSAVNLHRKQMHARGLRVDLLERRLGLLQEQFERDQVPATELLQAEIHLLDIRVWRTQAQVEYLARLMELGALLGDDPLATRTVESK
jgi:outer membrane protein